MTNIKYIDDYMMTEADLTAEDWSNLDFLTEAIVNKMASFYPNGYEWIIGTANHEYKIRTESEEYRDDLDDFELYIDGEFYDGCFSLEGIARVIEREG